MQQRILAFSRVALAATLVCLVGCSSTAGRKDVRLKAAVAPAAKPAVAPAAKPADPPAADPATARWDMSERDRTLKGALERWSQTAGWRLIWELGVDYRIEAQASIDGTFEAAISEVVKNMEHADVPPKAIFYRANQVLRVVARGTE